MLVKTISFPEFSGIRCLMMPYIQGEPESVPNEYRKGYESILESTYLERGSIGFLTIDESVAKAGSPHRGDRAKYGRALHTEVGRRPGKIYVWGGGDWGDSYKVELDRDVQILLANSISNTCAVWNVEHENTSIDGDIGDFGDMYPMSDAIMMAAGEVHQIGIFTPHESLPVGSDVKRQFIRIVSSGVHGREDYFTQNRLF